MALLWFTSPKPFGTTIANGSGVLSTAGTCSISANGRGGDLAYTGSSSAAIVTFADGFWLDTLTAGDTLVFGFHYYSTNAFSNNLAGVRFLNTAGTTLCELRVTSSLISWRDTSAQRAISVLTLADDTHYWIEGKILLATGTTGTIDIKVDGVSYISTTGVITQSSGTLSRASIAFFPNTGSNYCDCLLVADITGPDNNDFFGPQRAGVVYPAADTADKDFTPSTGTDNFAMVSEATPDGDSTYNESNTLGHKDLFDNSGSVTSADIKGVNIHLRCRKSVAGTQGIKGIVSSNGTESKTALAVPSTSFTSYMKTLPYDPDTNALWDAAGVNAALIGYELTLTP